MLHQRKMQPVLALIYRFRSVFLIANYQMQLQIVNNNLFQSRLGRDSKLDSEFDDAVVAAKKSNTIKAEFVKRTGVLFSRIATTR